MSKKEQTVEQNIEEILKKLNNIEDILNRPYEHYHEYPGDDTPQPEINLKEDELK